MPDKDKKDETPPLQSFDEIIDWQEIEDNTWSGTIHNSWMQGRSAFGGIPTGVALKALRKHCDHEKQQRPYRCLYLFSSHYKYHCTPTASMFEKGEVYRTLGRRNTTRSTD